MAQELLDAAQVAAAGEEVGREGMAQRVRGRGIRQAERAAQRLDGELDDARRERAAAGADEQRALGRQRVGAEAQVCLDRRAGPRR